MDFLVNIVGFLYSRYTFIMDFIYWGSTGPREIGFDLQVLSEQCGALLSAPIMACCVAMALVSAMSREAYTEDDKASLKEALIILFMGAFSFFVAKFAIYMLFAPPPKFYLLGPVGFLLTSAIIFADIAIMAMIAWMAWAVALLVIAKAVAGWNAMTNWFSRPAAPAKPEVVVKPLLAPKSDNLSPKPATKPVSPAAWPAQQTSKQAKPVVIYPHQPITATFNQPTPVGKPQAASTPTQTQSEVEATMKALNQYLGRC
ncbi:MAG: hypothetical protein NZ694_10510 [Tepidimonas sp.]|nr:hypothetical protein [Tepidimonas sp.]